MKLEGGSSTFSIPMLAQLKKRNWKHVQLLLSFSKGAVLEVLVIFAGPGLWILLEL